MIENIEEIILDEVEDYIDCENSLSRFIRAAWDVLEPGREYKHNWHIDCIAEHLEACYLGQIRRLIINMPPRNLKSISATVCFPVWVWLQDPTKRFMCASYSAELSTKQSVDRRDLIRSPWFQRAWGSRFFLVEDMDRKTLFKNDKRGEMFSTSVGGSSLGVGFDIGIIDDPQNPKMAASDVEREKANVWRDQSFSTRRNDKKTAVEIVIMQRLHDSDLTGHILKKDRDAWTVLKLEGQSTQNQKVWFPMSGTYRDYAKDEYLHNDREGEEEHKQAIKDLGSAGYRAQYQQDPQISKEGFFQRKWWKRYTEIPKDIQRICQFWDCAEEPGVSNDFSVCATWAECANGYYLIDLWKDKVEFPQLQNACLNQAQKFNVNGVYIENKSAGRQLIQNLRAHPLGCKLPINKYEPGQRSKIVRAAGAQPTVEAGNCHLPESASWDVEGFIQDHVKFPFAEHDDVCDCTSMMVEILVKPQRVLRVRSL